MICLQIPAARPDGVAARSVTDGGHSLESLLESEHLLAVPSETRRLESGWPVRVRTRTSRHLEVIQLWQKAVDIQRRMVEVH